MTPKSGPAPATDPTARPVRTIVAATAAATASVLPLSLLGGLAVLVREELGFDEAKLGLTVALFFGSAALASIPGGRMGEWIGPRSALMLAAVCSAATLLGIAWLTPTWGHLAGFMILGGVANGLAQPAGNLALARGVPLAHQGLAFGVKQSAIPVTGLLAGVSVPVLGLTVGWRWAFATGVLAVALLAAVLPPATARSTLTARRRPAGDTATGPLVVIATAGALGAAAAGPLGVFLVESAVAYGVGPGPAGLLLGVGSGVGIASRVFTGWLADRRGSRHLPVVASMLAVGAAGFAALAFGERSVPLLIAGTILSFSVGWGWPGLFIHAVVRLNSNAPAAATGITQAGAAAGSVTGPLAFGWIALHASFRAAWMAAAVTALVAALLTVIGRRLALQDRDRKTAVAVATDTGKDAAA